MTTDDPTTGPDGAGRAPIDPYSAAAARERLDAWRSSTDPIERDRAYAAVLRRQFGPGPAGIAPAAVTIIEADDLL